MNDKQFYTLEEIKNIHIGHPHTPERDRYEAELQSFLVGEAIKSARKAQNMTQAQLAEKIGVNRTQVSKMESGRNLTISNLARCFNAMGLSPSISIPGFGNIEL